MLRIIISLFVDEAFFVENENEIEISTLLAKNIIMELRIKSLGVSLKREKLKIRTGIEVVSGEKIKEVAEEGYKYLGTIKEEKMKNTFHKKYFKRVRLCRPEMEKLFSFPGT